MRKSRQQPALQTAGCCPGKRAHYVEVKEKSLNDIKQGAKYVTSNEDKLKLYEQLVNGYKAYEYDSAMTYVKKALFLPKRATTSYIIKDSNLAKPACLSHVDSMLKQKHHAEDRTQGRRSA